MDEIGIAEAAWTNGEHLHAAKHLGNALRDDPGSDRAYRLVRAMARRRNAADHFAPLDDGAQYLGKILLRAALHAEAGELSDAVALVVQCVPVAQEVALAPLIERWASDSRFAKTDPLELAAAFSSALDAEEPAYADMLGALRTVFPRDEALMFLHSRLARNAGRLDEALEIAESFHRRQPTYKSAVMVYGGLKALRRWDDAVAAIDDAISRAPDANNRCSALIDRGDTLMELARWTDAADAYRAALALAPGQPWCQSSIAYLAARGGDPGARKLLRETARGGDKRAQELVLRLGRREDLPAPHSAIVDVVTQVLASGPDEPPQDGSIKMSASAPEPPAALLAARAELRRAGWRVKMTLDVEGVPEPDPRRPLAATSLVLWAFDGHEPRPALDPPRPAIAARIAELATTDFDADLWLARMTELPPVDARELAAVMVHPPAAPDGILWWDWWYRVDVAAAFAIAACAREALWDLLAGPNDWSGRAAAVALQTIALADGDAAIPIVKRLIAHTDNHRPSFGDHSVWTAARDAMLAIANACGFGD
jgi:tetratricopeptide (TPR) repeat protein